MQIPPPRGVWHGAVVVGCLLLVAPIGLSPLVLLTPSEPVCVWWVGGAGVVASLPQGGPSACSPKRALVPGLHLTTMGAFQATNPRPPAEHSARVLGLDHWLRALHACPTMQNSHDPHTPPCPLNRLAPPHTRLLSNAGKRYRTGLFFMKKKSWSVAWSATSAQLQLMALEG